MAEAMSWSRGTESMDALTTPSMAGVATGYGALERAVGTVSGDVRAVTETLEALTGALGLISQSGGMGQEWGSFGLIGLPIMGAIRAVKAAASQYVKQQTGVALTTWAEFVSTSAKQFEAYVDQLDAVVALSRRRHDRSGLVGAEPGDSGVGGPGSRPEVGSEPTRQQLHEDLKTLLEVQWQTQAWKQVLGRVAQLGQVVDAILKAGTALEPGEAEVAPPETGFGLGAGLGKRLREAGTRGLDRGGGDLKEWVLRPFVDIGDRAKELPAQVAEISREVVLVEMLLDLQVAEVRACTGEIPVAEAAVVGQRVGASIILPELTEDLAEARQDTARGESHLERLRAAHDAGSVAEAAFATLAEEYEQDVQAGRSRLAALEEQARVWRQDGGAVIDACVEWVQRELDVLDARQLVEQSDDHLRRGLLEREQTRLHEARALLASL